MLGRKKGRRVAEAVIRDAGEEEARLSDSPDGGGDFKVEAAAAAEEARRVVAAAEAAAGRAEGAAEEALLAERREPEDLTDRAFRRITEEAVIVETPDGAKAEIPEGTRRRLAEELAGSRISGLLGGGRTKKPVSGNRPASAFPDGGPYRIAALDFETANGYRGSPCAIGIVLSDNGKVIHKERRLFRPPEGVDEFDEFNIDLHGITPFMVKHKPRYGEVLPDILEVIGSRPVVSHNAAFDMGVIRDACDTSGISRPSLTYICTLVLSRTVLDLPSYTLPIVAAELGIPLEDHHEPLTDAEAAARILFLLAERSGTDINTLLKPVRLGYMRPDEWSGCKKKRYGRRRGGGGSGPEIPETNLQAYDNFFYGKNIVLTGKLPYDITRQVAWEKIALLGGNPNKNITRKTDLLVIGEWNAWNLSADGYSLKYKKAEALRADGIKIETLSGLDFLALLEDEVAEAERMEVKAGEAVSP